MNRTEMYNPVSTCRIQFSKDFTFEDLRNGDPLPGETRNQDHIRLSRF